MAVLRLFRLRLLPRQQHRLLRLLLLSRLARLRKQDELRMADSQRESARGAEKRVVGFYRSRNRPLRLLR